MGRIDNIITILKRENKRYLEPIVTTVSRTRSPFKVLISCILSLRTKDKVTAEASNRLFKLADNPKKMLSISTRDIEKTIYPVGFYKTKSKRIKEICKILLGNYGGTVPDEIDELLKLKGVGRKTANLVVTLGYGKLGICVDTHVHRISNRLGLIKTKTPERTEFSLRKKLPKKYWIIYNDLLVAHGQNICTPISPKCSKCKIFKYCKRVGVKNFR
ncbi:MAG: endonuclease III [Candidatus Scalindua rubra]|uniref:Endonuclease III n=1 Tax=Candidatus Scalindua rubra TaxID=1872076 RepID=A0A1E3XEK6_9BACT|nr:MAG: endonuclease III [Candidatus Scalindua rubra]